jgi:hypothetical protein
MAKLSYQLTLKGARMSRTKNMKLARNPSLNSASRAFYVTRARRANRQIVKHLRRLTIATRLIKAAAARVRAEYAS